MDEPREKDAMVTEEPGPRGEPVAPEAPAPESYSFFQMFFVPMLIASVLTGVIVFFGLIGSDERDVHQYLVDIRSGSEHQRWQSAFQLAEHLQKRGNGEAVAEDDRRLLLDMFDEAAGRDPKIRPYLALAIGQVRVKEAVPSLVKALDDAAPTDPAADTRVYALFALGAIADPASEAAVVKALASDDGGIRKAAAFALGSIGGDEARSSLKRSLADPVADVAWNSALSLARLHDDSGKALLVQMVDRTEIQKTKEITEEQVVSVLESAARALSMIKAKEGIAALTQLSRTDPDHRVREAATGALAELGVTP